MLQDGGAGRRAESRLRLNGADAITKAHAMLTQQLDKARASKNLAMVKVFESMINMSIQKTRESCEQTRMQVTVNPPRSRPLLAIGHFENPSKRGTFPPYLAQ